ncbi:MAG: NHLP bacteriocin export ABC transporter permease/ATPase subunit, partial [Bacteroidota bacterium]
IAQISNARVRKVILRGEWWKEENGHLLAFTKEDHKPVALIQQTSDTYMLKDVETKTNQKVNRKVAESLDPIAYMFFYAFDEPMTSISKIWSFAIKGLKKDAWYIVLAALSGSLIGLLVPILSGILFDDVIPQADRGFLIEVFGIMLIIGLVTALLRLIQGVLQLRLETKSNINVQAGLMDHLLRLPITFYRKYSAGDLTLRALSINSIRQILSSTVLTAVLSGAFSFVNLFLLFYYDSSLAWVGIGLALFAVTVVIGIGFLKLKYDREIAQTNGDIQGFLFEFLSGITKIRVTGAEQRIFSIWADRFSDLKLLGFRSGSHQNYVEVFNGSYPLVTNIFFFGFIYYTIQTAGIGGKELISVGAFMAFVTAFNQFLNDCLNISMALITSLNMIPLYERVKPILEEVPESTDESGDPGELKGEIELNSVNFRYAPDQPLVLKDVSFRIKQGEMVAFVGPSGSGKSTVLRILLGFEEPESGSVYYDGQAYDSLNKDLVRRQLGVVLQNGALMAGSIYKNIVGNSELNLEDAWQAAKMAGMEEDIKQMPMEMHTVISEGAGTFSGGQRQRLMIARAIVHKPRILYMDEATSALDNRTQNIVSESLDRLQATRIVIAHRLSTVINADRIYVMEDGVIVESGTYQELIEQDGLFSKLAKRQIA